MTERMPRVKPLAWLIDAVNHRDRSDCWTDYSFVTTGWAGYPKLRDGSGRLRQASHVAMELDGRPQPPPPRNFGLHSCDNPPCLNPDHLRWGTKADNTADTKLRGQYSPPPRNSMQPPLHLGEQQHAAKLTADTVRQMRSMYATGGWTYRALAEMFGVSKPTAMKAIKRQQWKHVD